MTDTFSSENLSLQLTNTLPDSLRSYNLKSKAELASETIIKLIQNGSFKKETILNPLIYNNKPITNPALIFWALFVLTTVFASYLYLSNKAKNDNKALYFSLLAAVLYNFCANFFWCPKMGFLFSQNFLVLLFIIMAMSINNINSYLKTKKYSNCFKYSLIICLSVLLFFEITLNTKTVLRQHNNAIKYNPQNLLLEKR